MGQVWNGVCASPGVQGVQSVGPETWMTDFSGPTESAQHMRGTSGAAGTWPWQQRALHGQDDDQVAFAPSPLLLSSFVPSMASHCSNGQILAIGAAGKACGQSVGVLLCCSSQGRAHIRMELFMAPAFSLAAQRGAGLSLFAHMPLNVILHATYDTQAGRCQPLAYTLPQMVGEGVPHRHNAHPLGPGEGRDKCQLPLVPIAGTAPHSGDNASQGSN